MAGSGVPDLERVLGVTSGVEVREERPKLPKRPGVGAAVARPRRDRARRAGVSFMIEFCGGRGCGVEKDCLVGMKS